MTSPELDPLNIRLFFRTLNNIRSTTKNLLKKHQNNEKINIGDVESTRKQPIAMEKSGDGVSFPKNPKNFRFNVGLIKKKPTNFGKPIKNPKNPNPNQIELIRKLLNLFS